MANTKKGKAIQPLSKPAQWDKTKAEEDSDAAKPNLAPLEDMTEDGRLKIIEEISQAMKIDGSRVIPNPALVEMDSLLSQITVVPRSVTLVGNGRVDFTWHYGFDWLVIQCNIYGICITSMVMGMKYSFNYEAAEKNYEFLRRFEVYLKRDI